MPLRVDLRRYTTDENGIIDRLGVEGCPSGDPSSEDLRSGFSYYGRAGSTEIVGRASDHRGVNRSSMALELNIRHLPGQGRVDEPR